MAPAKECPPPPGLDDAAVNNALGDRLRCGFDVILLRCFHLIDKLANGWKYFIVHFQFLHFLFPL